MRLLIVEDDRRLSDVLRRGLTEQGHAVDAAFDGAEGEQWAASGSYDAIILDLNLPIRDGIAVVHGLRRRNVQTPILILTSRDTTEDVVEGLDGGADDYLCKPFAFAELEARLRSIFRRGPAAVASSELRCDDVVFDLAARRARRGERLLNLTPRETTLLEYLMRNKNRLLTRTMIEDAIFDRDHDAVSNVLDAYVSRLRNKLTENGEAPIIHTIRGVGYRFGPT